MKRRSLLSSPLVWGISIAACSGPVERDARVESPAKVPHPEESADSASSPVPPSGLPTSSPSQEVKSSGLDLPQELERRSVTSSSVHKVLYSWTTQAQLEELAAGTPLLSREASATRGPAAFDDLVSSQSERGRDVAKLLFSQGFAKKRFAWPNAFATVTGEADGPYGDVLLRIELKSEAWILDYASGLLFGVDGSRGQLSDAMAHPERIAAVFFLGNGYREFVLVNESMISRWSAGSAKEVIDALDEEIAFLGAAANGIEEDGAVKPGIPSSTEILLEGALAFNRKLSPAELRDRAKTLAKVRGTQSAALSKTPEATFARGKPRIPTTPVCKVVRKESRLEARFIGSYAGPKRPIFTPVCGPANPSVVCIVGQGDKASDATCTPQPGFGR